MRGWEGRSSQSSGKGGVVRKDRECMIKAYILKSLTSPLVWLMGPASQSDRGKGLEKWCNYCFLNRGLKRPVWKKDLEEILQGILDSRLPPLHPSILRHTPWSLRALILPFPSEVSLVRHRGLVHALCKLGKAINQYVSLSVLLFETQTMLHIPLIDYFFNNFFDDMDFSI